MKQFKISCSQIGKIMAGTIGLSEAQQEKLDGYFLREKEALTNPKKALTEKMEKDKSDLIEKSKNIELPTGAKTYVKNWLKEQLYDRKKMFTSKQTTKGNKYEDQAISVLVKELELPWNIEKNEERFYGDYIVGEMDLLPFGSSYLEDLIIDTKCSFDCFTFPLFKNELDNDYWWQGQGYMHLTGRSKYVVAYVLTDIEEEELNEMVSKERWKISNAGKLDSEIYDELKYHHTYSHLPLHLRLKLYRFEYSESKIKEVIRRVKLCRDYVNELLQSDFLNPKEKEFLLQSVEKEKVA